MTRTSSGSGHRKGISPGRSFPGIAASIHHARALGAIDEQGDRLVAEAGFDPGHGDPEVWAPPDWKMDVQHSGAEFASGEDDVDGWVAREHAGDSHEHVQPPATVGFGRSGHVSFPDFRRCIQCRNGTIGGCLHRHRDIRPSTALVRTIPTAFSLSAILRSASRYPGRMPSFSSLPLVW